MKKEMAKKKIEYSDYQKAIFDFVLRGQGNVVVEACAGSGKTTALLKCIDLLGDDLYILATAFNREIVNVLKRKTKDKSNVCAMTMHSIGLQMLNRNFHDAPLELDEFKYRAFVTANIRKLASIDTYKLGKRYFSYIDNICKYINFGRAYLLETVKDMNFIEDRYDIDTIADEKAVAIQAMNWGKKHLETIDYTDMIWLPNVLMCNPLGQRFDWIFADEVQDMNRAQRELLLKCRRINTRICAVGDSSQCIFSFNGGDPDSFDAFKSLPNTITLPLSITYRCADDIVSYAQQLVPTIEKNNDHRKGIIKENAELDEIHDGDMVLCRNNAPLMKIYNEFIREGKKCFIRGKDIGNNMKRIIKNTNQKQLSQDLKSDGVFPQLYSHLFDARDDLMMRSNLDEDTAMQSELMSNKLDTIKALETLSEGLTTADELIAKIADVFSDRKKNGIILSTIHKAKGLEADHVFIACRSLMPSHNAKKDWEIKQEQNLMYVAYTRAKNELAFLDESDFKDFQKDQGFARKHLHEIETRVNALLGKKPRYITSVSSAAYDIISKAKKINLPKPNNVSLSKKEVDKQTKETSLRGMFKPKLVKRKKRTL